MAVTEEYLRLVFESKDEDKLAIALARLKADMSELTAQTKELMKWQGAIPEAQFDQELGKITSEARKTAASIDQVKEALKETGAVGAAAGLGMQKAVQSVQDFTRAAHDLQVGRPYAAIGALTRGFTDMAAAAGASPLALTGITLGITTVVGAAMSLYHRWNEVRQLFLDTRPVEGLKGMEGQLKKITEESGKLTEKVNLTAFEQAKLNVLVGKQGELEARISAEKEKQAAVKKLMEAKTPAAEEYDTFLKKESRGVIEYRDEVIAAARGPQDMEVTGLISQLKDAEAKYQEALKQGIHGVVYTADEVSGAMIASDLAAPARRLRAELKAKLDAAQLKQEKTARELVATALGEDDKARPAQVDEAQKRLLSRLAPGPAREAVAAVTPKAHAAALEEEAETESRAAAGLDLEGGRHAREAQRTHLARVEAQRVAAAKQAQATSDQEKAQADREHDAAVKALASRFGKEYEGAQPGGQPGLKEAVAKREGTRQSPEAITAAFLGNLTDRLIKAGEDPALAGPAAQSILDNLFRTLRVETGGTAEGARRVAGEEQAKRERGTAGEARRAQAEQERTQDAANAQQILNVEAPGRGHQFTAEQAKSAAAIFRKRIEEGFNVLEATDAAIQEVAHAAQAAFARDEKLFEPPKPVAPKAPAGRRAGPQASTDLEAIPGEGTAVASAGDTSGGLSGQGPVSFLATAAIGATGGAKPVSPVFDNQATRWFGRHVLGSGPQPEATHPLPAASAGPVASATPAISGGPAPTAEPEPIAAQPRPPAPAADASGPNAPGALTGSPIDRFQRFLEAGQARIPTEQAPPLPPPKAPPAPPETPAGPLLPVPPPAAPPAPAPPASLTPPPGAAFPDRSMEVPGESAGELAARFHRSLQPPQPNLAAAGPPLAPPGPAGVPTAGPVEPPAGLEFAAPAAPPPAVEPQIADDFDTGEALVAGPPHVRKQTAIERRIANAKANRARKKVQAAARRQRRKPKRGGAQRGTGGVGPVTGGRGGSISLPGKGTVLAPLQQAAANGGKAVEGLANLTNAAGKIQQALDQQARILAMLVPRTKEASVATRSPLTGIGSL